MAPLAQACNILFAKGSAQGIIWFVGLGLTKDSKLLSHGKFRVRVSLGL